MRSAELVTAQRKLNFNFLVFIITTTESKFLICYKTNGFAWKKEC